MTINETYAEWFEKPMREYIKKQPKEVLEYIQKNPDTLIIKERSIGLEEVKRRAQDPTYLQENAKIKDGVLIVNDFNDDVVAFVKDNAPKTITRIEVPKTFFENIEIIKEFPKLKTIIVDGYFKLTPEEIDFIKENTSISEISTTTGVIVKYDYEPRKGEILLNSPSQVFISGNLISRANKESFTSTKVEAVINGTDIDFSLLEKACKNAIYSKDKAIDKISVVSVPLAEAKEENEDLFTIELNTEGEVEVLKYNGKDDITKLSKVVAEIEKTKKIKKIIVECYNKTYDNLYYLNPIAKKCDLQIDYGDVLKCSLEEFSAMRETIDWFNELVRSNNLSPAEITLFAYDIMKTFKYKENHQDKEQSRYLHNIVMNEYIVCCGYAKFLEQLLKENGIPAEKISVSCNVDKKEPDGHARNLVRIDDNKYKIHGVFCLDATWDSTKDRLALVETQDDKYQIQFSANAEDIVERNFNTEGLYHYFLVPAQDYPKVFPKDSIPGLIKRTLEDTLDELEIPASSFLDEDNSSLGSIDALFSKGVDMDSIKGYMHAKKPSLETFKSILYNVRIAQGYTREAALSSIEENIELNQMLDELNYSEHTFFQSEQLNRSQTK